MSFKSPTADDAFNRWLQRAKGGSIKKLFGIKKKEKVSAAESVKNVDKSVVFAAKIEASAKKVDEKTIKDPLTHKKASTITFYTPEGAQEYANKKGGKVAIALFPTLKEVKCKKCGGSGKTVCKVCNGKGHQTCKTCNGAGGIDCKHCKGRGALVYEVTVIDKEEKKKKEELKQNCLECFGEKKAICPTCGGLGKHSCNNCKAVGAHYCKDCNGAGTLLEFKEAFYETPKGREEYDVHAEKRYEFLEKDLKTLLSNATGIKFKSSKELEKDKVEPILGYYNESVDGLLRESKKDFSNLEKEGRVKGEILMFPVLQLQCEGSKTGKRFELFSTGTEDGFFVLDKGVP